MADEQGTGKLFGEGLPGTGGDFIDQNDTEGHAGTGDDTSGGKTTLRGWGEDGDGRTRSKFIDEQDVEGHLYRTGPTTSGDVAKRAPTDNPHGDS
jgi:hypothetical protein